jgi:heme/copper-type cytochrome/quinol oxidase subunit 2
MKHIFIIRRMSALYTLVMAVALIGGAYYAYHLFTADSGVSTSSGVKGESEVKEFHIITTEFKTKLPDGKELEIYRWDPGTIVVNEGDKVTLRFFGVQGNLHPFEIKGLGVKGEVKKGRETKVTFIADKEGTYEIVCLSHPDYANQGPMIGYLVVD